MDAQHRQRGLSLAEHARASELGRAWADDVARSSGPTSLEELRAVIAVTQSSGDEDHAWDAAREHWQASLASDLERSNPERPWRLLHANFAITAIRTEDPLLMDYAFDALDRALPDERAGFYSEALALAMNPRISALVRERIEARHLKWTPA